MGFFLGVKRAAAFWAPQLAHLLRQATAALLLLLFGFKLGVEFGGRFSAGRIAGSFWWWATALFIVYGLLGAWESRGRAAERTGFEVVPRRER